MAERSFQSLMSSGFFASFVSLRNDAEFLLLLKDPLTNHIPTLIEAALLLLDIRLREHGEAHARRPARNR